MGRGRRGTRWPENNLTAVRRQLRRGADPRPQPDRPQSHYHSWFIELLSVLFPLSFGLCWFYLITTKRKMKGETLGLKLFTSGVTAQDLGCVLQSNSV